MKILFLLENMIGHLEGGTEVSSYHLASLLRRKHHNVEEWTPFIKRKSPFLYTNFFSQLLITVVIFRKILKDNIRIIHVQGKYLTSSAVFVGKILHIPTVVTIRDYVVVCPIGLCLFDQALSDNHHNFEFFFKKEIPRFFYRYHHNDHRITRMMRYMFLTRGWLVTQWLQFWLKRADDVISVSHDVQRVLNEHGIASHVIYNTFDTSLIKDFPSSFTAHPSSLILFVGKPSYGKGYDLFVSLSRQKKFQRYNFRTIGGENKLDYKQTLKEIRKARIVVVPSRWKEPFGRVALESLFMGTPVVATKSGGLKEIVEDKANGRVCHAASLDELSRALVWALKNNELLRKKIRNQNELLTEKFMTQPLYQHIALYKRMLSKGSGMICE